MARGYSGSGNVPYGVGATDSIVTSLKSHASSRSYSIWLWRSGYNDGEIAPDGANNQRLFDKRTGGADVENVFWDGSGGANTDLFIYKRTWTTGGVWTWTKPPFKTWTHFALTYDGSSTANNPAVYHNGVVQTVTRSTAPTGTIVTSTDAYVIGNLTVTANRGWDGYLAEFAVWDRILSPPEIQLLAGDWSPLLFRVGLVEYVPLDGTVESKVRGPLKPTVTGTLWRPHPLRTIKPTRFRPYFLDRVDWVKQPWKLQGGMGPLIAQ